ncbi:hypothetical protein [Paraburkholderia sp. 40]|uniref:hypothetical protein n=1 Tax=Paraburkholderia sp. 40 TaxID=2991059 RepID=UPI003D1D485D
MPTMDASAAQEALHTRALLMAAAFGKETGLTGSARAVARTALFTAARRYIDANLGQSDLTVDSVLAMSQLSRPTVSIVRAGGWASRVYPQPAPARSGR